MIFVKLVEQELKIKLIKEFRFSPDRKWRFDYCNIELKIAIEVEGGAFTRGRHTRGKGFIDDMEKYNEAVILGWRLLRFTPDKLLTFKSLDLINKLIK
jgi:very-short-patch-repair endonuclease